jgi:hypothetical protein
MERGFTVDRGHLHAPTPGAWASGEPTTPFWRFGAPHRGERVLEVVSYRCRGCGLLESYAPEPAADDS